jgi:hypothetical protein
VSNIVLTPARAIVRFDASAPMGLVLADFLSNQTYRMLRSHARCSLAEIRERVASTLSLSLLAAPAAPTATTTLPSVCADGIARERIRDAYVGRSTTAQGLNPTWNREQAGQWIDFASNKASSS